MAPIKQIEQGIATGDWRMVADGFAALTGKYVSPPANQEPTSLVDLLTKAIALAQNNDDPEPQEVIEEQKQPAKPVVKKPRAKKTHAGKQEANTESSSSTVFYGGEDVPLTEADIAINQQAKNKPAKPIRTAKKETFTCSNCSTIQPLSKLTFTSIGTSGGANKQICLNCKRLGR